MPGQQQHLIPLHFLDGTSGRAVRTGNNAAWMCGCGYELPLVGYSDQVDALGSASLVHCAGCGSQYRVVADALMKAPTEVRQMSQ
jgi:hypothetical protein